MVQMTKTAHNYCTRDTGSRDCFNILNSGNSGTGSIIDSSKESSSSVLLQHNSTCSHVTSRSESLLGSSSDDVNSYLDPPGIDRFRILQWNIRGLTGSSGLLHDLMTERSPDVCMLQEVQTHYDKNYYVKQFRGWNSHMDTYKKTGIFIQDHIHHGFIPLYNTVTSSPVDHLHATAAWIKIDLYGSPKLIVLLNVYLSPSGNGDIHDVSEYIHIIRNALGNQQIYGWILGGDLNASHPIWGAPENHDRTSAKYKRGHEVLDLANIHGYHIINSGQPTWGKWIKPRDAHQRHYIESWLDVTMSKGIDQNRIHHWVLQQDWNSDHYPIFIDVSDTKPIQYKSHPDTSYTWKLNEKEEDWHSFQDLLQDKWRMLQPTLLQLQDTIRDGTNAPESTIEYISNEITTMYHNTAYTVFGCKDKAETWHKWVGEDARAASIKYHRYWRRMKKKSRLNNKHWKKLKQLKRERNRLMKSQKKEWLRKKFNHYDLSGKEGWQIAAEVRDLNTHQGKPVPDFVDPDNPQKIIATAVDDKVQSLLEWYHRFDTLPNLADNAGYPVDVVNRNKCVRQPIPRRNSVTNIQHDRSTLEPETSVPVRYQGTDHYSKNQESLNINVPDLNHQYGQWLLQETTLKWNKCKQVHLTELNKLNKPITTPEIRRALRSFGNNKAYGPDFIHIRFLKKTESTSLEILGLLYSLCFQYNYFPDLLKRRWIIPLLKPGKKGTIRKDWRPISLTSYVAKIYEKVLCYRLVTYLVKLHLIAPVNFAYLMGRSTQDCITFIVDKIMRNMNEKATTHSVFFDFSSAFDTVRYNVLIWKLQNEFFISGPFLKAIQAFLTGRHSAVKFLNRLSDWQSDVIGVPQGGALSPILFLLYTNSIGLLAHVYGLEIGIFADDICIFTDGVKRSRKKISRIKMGLQEGVTFIQWYSMVNGLKLNYDKTNYKIFKKGTIAPDDLWKIYISSSINHHNPNLVKRIEEDAQIEHQEAPVKYLGIWMDSKLNWSYHSDKLLKKCQVVYHTINSNLNQLWNIHANIAWQILEACVLSILDYSALILSIMKEKDKKQLRLFYNQVLRKVYHPVKDIQLWSIHHQLQVFDFDCRWQYITSKYFTHLLRLPVTSILSIIFYQTWWKPIKSIIINARQDFVTATYQYGKLADTLIWKVCYWAYQTQCSDIQSFSSRLQYFDIHKEISYYIDLTEDWRAIDLIPEPFLDESYATQSQLITEKELLVFTDGSVKDLRGGFGTHIIRGTDYLRSCHSTQGYYGDCMELLFPLREDSSEPLSHRSSIDFCEAMAIRKVLQNVERVIPEPATCENRTINTIRIVTDSNTVLNWLYGTYTVRNNVMKQILDDIHWKLTDINQNYANWNGIRFQWVHSHDNTKGNEFVDGLAKQGMNQTRFIKHTKSWKYYSKSAVNTEIKHYYRSKMEQQLLTKVASSRHGYLYRDNNISWHSIYRRELMFLNRDEMRILTAIRTGHCKLPYYRYFFHESDINRETVCDTCNMDDDLHHRILQCRKRHYSIARVDFISTVAEIYTQFDSSTLDKSKDWDIRSLNYQELGIYVFPDAIIPMETRVRILKETCKIGRIVLGYQYRD